MGISHLASPEGPTRRPHRSQTEGERMFKKCLILASMSLLLVAGAAYAGTPFGGDDTGFLPPGGSKGAVGKCEAAISKAASKAVACISKCHDSRASGKLADDTDEDACENANNGKSCLAKYFS